MRRKDREVTDISEIEEILKRGEVLRIAMNDGKYPYIIPVNYGFEMNGGELTLFFHGSKDGKKHEVIRKDNHAAFEIDCGHMLIPPSGDESCTASYAYESVIGTGIIEKAADDEKEKLLIAILNHYGIKFSKFNPMHLANTVVYKITAESYTAKRRKS